MALAVWIGSAGCVGDDTPSMERVASLMEAQRYDDAREMAWRLLPALTDSADHDPLELATLIEMLARSTLQADRPADARTLELSRQAVEIRREHQGPDHTDTEAVTELLADVLFVAGEYAEAAEVRREVLSLREVRLGPRHPHVGTTLYQLGRDLGRAGAKEKAVPYLQRALEIREEAGQMDPLGVAVVLEELAVTLPSDDERVARILERANAIRGAEASRDR